MKDQKNHVLIIILVILILLFSGSSLFMLISGLLNDTLSNDFFLIILQLVVVIGLAMKVSKIQQSLNQPKSDGSDLKTGDHEALDSSRSKDDVPSSEKKKTSKKAFYQQGLPLIILAVSFGIVILNQTGFSLFGNSSPEGRWIHEMEENTMVGGVINLTDYWYMDFYDDGTLNIGWKNVNVAEDSEGVGSWYIEGNIIYVTIHYDYGETVYIEYIIRSNQLVDANTHLASGFFRD